MTFSPEGRTKRTVLFQIAATTILHESWSCEEMAQHHGTVVTDEYCDTQSVFEWMTVPER
jgi:hypothetical protein